MEQIGRLHTGMLFEIPDHRAECSIAGLNHAHLLRCIFQGDSGSRDDAELAMGTADRIEQIPLAVSTATHHIASSGHHLQLQKVVHLCATPEGHETEPPHGDGSADGNPEPVGDDGRRFSPVGGGAQDDIPTRTRFHFAEVVFQNTQRCHRFHVEDQALTHLHLGAGGMGEPPGRDGNAFFPAETNCLGHVFRVSRTQQCHRFATTNLAEIPGGRFQVNAGEDQIPFKGRKTLNPIRNRKIDFHNFQPLVPQERKQNAGTIPAFEGRTGEQIPDPVNERIIILLATKPLHQFRRGLDASSSQLPNPRVRVHQFAGFPSGPPPTEHFHKGNTPGSTVGTPLEYTAMKGGKNGAGDGIRTHDNHVGNVMLYP